MAIARTLALWWFALTMPVADAAVTVNVVDISTRGVTVRVAYVKPDAPIANLLLFPGANGVAGLTPFFAGDDLSFTYAELGIAVAYVDAPSDYPSGLTKEFRQSPEHAADALAVIEFVRQQADVPIWLGGRSNGTVSVTYFAINLPPELPFGIVLVSSRTVDGNLANSIFSMDLESIRRPILVLAHMDDPCPVTPPSNAALIFARLTSAPAKELVVLTGGIGTSFDPCNGGHHLFDGQQDEVTSTVAAFIKKYNSLLVANVAVPNFQGMWWNAPAESEAGWGVNFAHEGEVIFATWFTHDANGNAWNLSMTAFQTGPNAFTGTLVVVTGPPFGTDPFNLMQVHATPAGTATLTFADGNHGTFTYTVNGLMQTKSITRQVFGVLPTCVWGALADLTLATNYTDMWWVVAGVESGWGINFAHQSNAIFATWFTFDLLGNPLPMSATLFRVGTSNEYSGTLVRTSGPPFSADPWDPGAVMRAYPGTATVTFINGNRATFTYSVTLNAAMGPVMQTKQLERQVLRAPGTVCQ